MFTSVAATVTVRARVVVVTVEPSTAPVVLIVSVETIVNARDVQQVALLVPPRVVATTAKVVHAENATALVDPIVSVGIRVNAPIATATVPCGPCKTFRLVSPSLPLVG